MARLAKDVLAEIPDQFLSYMRTRGIKPAPAPPPYTPPPYTPPGLPIQTDIWEAVGGLVGWGGRGFQSQGGGQLNFSVQSTSTSLKPLSMPCRRGSRWSFSCSGSCMSCQESVTCEARKSQRESVYFHCRAFLSLSGISFLSPGKPGQAPGRVRRVWIPAGRWRRNGRGNVGQLWKHCKDNVSRQKKKKKRNLEITGHVSHILTLSSSLRLTHCLQQTLTRIFTIDTFIYT